MNGELAETIRAARKRKGWTQAQLAEAVGTTQSVISEIETGARLISHFDTLRRIAAALDLQVTVLLTQVESAPTGSAA